MADKQGAAPASGKPGRDDQTTMPGQYPSHLPFGIPVPKTTNAPGTPGAGFNDDPTVHTPTPEDNFGASFNDLKTGSPGTQGTSGTVSKGALYTDPFAWLAGGGEGAKSGGSTDTEAEGNKYGDSTMPGVKGNQPAGTGAPGSVPGGSGGDAHVMHGGRDVH